MVPSATPDLVGMDKLVGRPVKLNTATTTEKDKVLVPIGDLHYGAPNCDIEKVKRTLEFCRKRNAWILLMGDLLEAATRYSVGAGVYEQVANPQEQLEFLVELFEPYKDLIIGSHDGNHCFRITKETGVNIMKVFCKMLGIRYLGYSINHCLRVGSQRYIIYSTHGSSGATLRHTKIKKVLDIAQWNKADAYLYAHVHTLEARFDEYREYDARNKMMVTKTRVFCLTGSFLNYDGSYADMKNYAPEKTGVINLHLNGEKFAMHVTT